MSLHVIAVLILCAVMVPLAWALAVAWKELKRPSGQARIAMGPNSQRYSKFRSGLS